MSGRMPVERKLTSEARKLAMRLKRCEELAEQMRLEAEVIDAELSSWVARESDRLGREVPKDALLLDVLANVEVGPNDTWIWVGSRNNKDLPTIKYRTDDGRSSERSVPRFLSEAFGLIEPDAEGILYPTTHPGDVNPWHRRMREFPLGVYRGNPRRYDLSGGQP